MNQFEKPKGRRFFEIGSDMPPLMEPGQNIVGQPPFLEVLTHVLPEDFFNPEHELVGLAHVIRCVVTTPERWDLLKSAEPVSRIQKHINLHYWNETIEHHHQTVLEFLDPVAYWEQYIREYWIAVNDVFALDGTPKKSQHPQRKHPLIVPTFAAYQSNRRGDPWFGLESELPGIESATTLTQKLTAMTQRGINKTFRVIGSYTGSQE